MRDFAYEYTHPGELLKINPEIKKIVSSGFGDEDTRKGIFSMAKGSISKPYQVADMVDTVRKVLNV